MKFLKVLGFIALLTLLIGLIALIVVLVVYLKPQFSNEPDHEHLRWIILKFGIDIRLNVHKPNANNYNGKKDILAEFNSLLRWLFF